MPISLFTSLFAVVGLGGILLALFYLALRRPVILVVLFLALWIVTVALTRSVTLSVTVSSVQVYPMDVLALVMAASGAARVLSRGVASAARGLVLVLLTLLVLHISRGIAEFGLQTAVNSTRGWLYFVAALAYAATVPGGWDRRVWKTLTSAGVLLALTAVPFWLTGGLGSAGEMVVHNGELVTSRPIVAAGALLILQAAVLALALHWPSRRSAPYAALGCAVVLVLLQHRTLWVAGAVVAAVGFVWWLAGIGRAQEKAAFAAIGTILLLLPLTVAGFLSTGPLVRSAGSATSGNSTFTWRTTGWEELIASHHSVSQLVVGEGSGASMDRVLNGHTVAVSAHNGFVEAYLGFGIPGVLAVVWLGLMLWFRRRGVAVGIGLTAHAVGLLLLTQLAFSITYQLDAVQGIITGVLVSGLTVSNPARRSVALWPASSTLGRAVT